MKLVRRMMVYSTITVLAAGLAAIVNPGAASAHGAMMRPGSRTYLCWQDGLSGSSGNIVPKNPACAAAVAQSGAGALYNWFAVLRSDGAGRRAGFIPDGQLCSGGTGGPYNFSGFNLARADWPVTHLTSGATMTFDYNNWAKHPGTFYLYITKDSWSPTRPLAWSDLEATPFSQATDPTSIGGPGTNDGRYTWSARLPAGKTGRHIIYSVWSRSDSTETFYNCSDVVFDGGNGQVTGVGTTGGTNNPPITRPPVTEPPVTEPPGTSPVVTTPPVEPPPLTSSAPAPGGTGGCTATYTPPRNWPGGFQGGIVVTNTGSASISGWTVNLTYGDGQDVAQVWSAAMTRNGAGNLTFRNHTWNGSIAPGATRDFGFIGSGSGGAPTLTCTVA